MSGCRAEWLAPVATAVSGCCCVAYELPTSGRLWLWLSGPRPGLRGHQRIACDAAVALPTRPPACRASSACPSPGAPTHLWPASSLFVEGGWFVEGQPTSSSCRSLSKGRHCIQQFLCACAHHPSAPSVVPLPSPFMAKALDQEGSEEHELATPSPATAIVSPDSTAARLTALEEAAEKARAVARLGPAAVLEGQRFSPVGADTPAFLARAGYGRGRLLQGCVRGGAEAAADAAGRRVPGRPRAPGRRRVPFCPPAPADPVPPPRPRARAPQALAAVLAPWPRTRLRSPRPAVARLRQVALVRPLSATRRRTRWRAGAALSCGTIRLP